MKKFRNYFSINFIKHSYEAITASLFSFLINKNTLIFISWRVYTLHFFYQILGKGVLYETFNESAWLQHKGVR